MASKNEIAVRLTNERGHNHGGWAFAFRAQTAEGELLLPRAGGE